MILFSTGCPKCKILEKKLGDEGIEYEVTTDIQELLDNGIKQAPVLKTEEGQYLDFNNAIRFIRSYRSGK